jgi:hypothetical protein
VRVLEPRRRQLSVRMKGRPELNLLPVIWPATILRSQLAVPSREEWASRGCETRMGLSRSFAAPGWVPGSLSAWLASPLQWCDSNAVVTIMECTPVILTVIPLSGWHPGRQLAVDRPPLTANSTKASLCSWESSCVT